MNVVKRLAERQNILEKHMYRPILIACLGDSVTHGCFEVYVNRFNRVTTVYSPEDGYASQLQRRLRDLYPTAAPTVLNAGVSGDSSRGGLGRLERDVLSFKPDLVTVNFGLNDAMNPNVEEGLAAYTENMRTIFERILASGAEAMLVTPNFMCEYVSHKLQDETLRNIAENAANVQNSGVLARYVNAAREVARSMNVPIADAFARWEAWKAGGVDTTEHLSNSINHPTKEAHDIFTEEILRIMFAE